MWGSGKAISQREEAAIWCIEKQRLRACTDLDVGYLYRVCDLNALVSSHQAPNDPRCPCPLQLHLPVARACRSMELLRSSDLYVL